ncbi:hypothetical protein Kpol_331p3 [Vanderwaltozyma polyspora DSM 70294]|uniref:Pre-rRNA-processing protein ESF2 n=1 Tax=Vanderwaltozyma polyspora (strain ATCC 22028 / DSM 70294 / BCRC 21397 / CBS 2163 / NBRC 10782 / NRRL Y-8283 / UCD 57-17) TaxID=436907 RepID=A7TT14_VANPO|nr:uncharacterized protein Kpol_331p3 [Vanderwaltozyma polyspora DSM 70294]EDO14593.1 hypothetical protein Kpol_331p3 [Vanderwaltozyma polyspora DSM 70294]
MSSDNSDFNDFSSDEEDTNQVLLKSKKSIINPVFEKNDEDENSDDETNNNEEEVKGSDLDPKDDKGDEEIEENDVMVDHSTIDKAKALNKRLAKISKVRADKKNHKTGVVYLSSIPPYMKPAKMRQILSRFGELDRLFLKREDTQKHKLRVQHGGNKKNMYEEGWAEFIRKRDAKLCAETLNGNIIGGKKGTFYHDDILNVKYLPGFKWADLTEQIARENDIRQSKLDLEIAQANKLNAEFIRNVEKSKMIANIKMSKQKRNIEDNEEDNNPRRNFKQHKVATNRADAPKRIKQEKSKNIDNVLTDLL